MVYFSLISWKSIDAACGAFMGLGAIVVAMRFYVRRKQHAALKADDWLTIPAYAFYVGTCIAEIVGTKHKAVGWKDPPHKIDQLHRQKFITLLYYSFDILSTLSYGCIKASALLFYYRIFCPRGLRSTFGIVVTVMLVLVALWTLAFVILLPMQCGAVISAAWTTNPLIRAKHCGGSPKDVEGWTISDVILDFLIIILPLPLIFRLKTSFRRKLGITAVFFLAFIGFCASVARMAITVAAIQASKSGAKVPVAANLTSQVQFYTILSGGLCLIAVNLPSLWLLFSKGGVPEKVLRSIRSLVSLRSVPSRGSSGYSVEKGSAKSGKHGRGGSGGHGGGTVEQDKIHLVNMVNPEAGSYQYQVRANSEGSNRVDLENGGVNGFYGYENGYDRPPMPPSRNILVKDTVTQRVERR